MSIPNPKKLSFPCPTSTPQRWIEALSLEEEGGKSNLLFSRNRRDEITDDFVSNRSSKSDSTRNNRRGNPNYSFDQREITELLRKLETTSPIKRKPCVDCTQCTKNTWFCCLVETAGFEPATSCMSSMHSNQLSYASMNVIYYTTLSMKLQALFESFLGFFQNFFSFCKPPSFFRFFEKIWGFRLILEAWCVII